MASAAGGRSQTKNVSKPVRSEWRKAGQNHRTAECVTVERLPPFPSENKIKKQITVPLPVKRHIKKKVTRVIS